MGFQIFRQAHRNEVGVTQTYGPLQEIKLPLACRVIPLPWWGPKLPTTLDCS